MKITTLKGMHDIKPPEIAVWHWVEKTIREVLEGAFFSELRTPVVEEEALFTRSIGNATEIVEKELYHFTDRKGRKLALRPEGTASIVRSFNEHFATAGGKTHRFYYLGPMFRYERPQQGRYRQFYQMGAEVFGSKDPRTDAELIFLAHEIFKRLKLTTTELQINSLGCKTCRPNFRETLSQFLSSRIQSLCADCQRRIQKNPLRALDCKIPTCIEATAGAPSSLDHLCSDCQTHFEGLQQRLTLLKVPYRIHARLVRGLDYYERTAFEFVNTQLGAQNAVAGGGRYDDLVHDLGGPSTPAVGFAIGMERLVSLVSGYYPVEERRKKIFFACLGSEAQTRMIPHMMELRNLGWATLMSYENESLKSMLRQADRLEVDYTVIVGEEEIRQGLAQVKEMKTTGGQSSVGLADLAGYFLRL